ncbi:MAG: glycine betaine ABC transporter substrate-binding protein [Dehalococcoidia bacterium]
MRKKRLSKWMLLASAVMVVVLVAAACGGEEEEEAAAPAAEEPTAAAPAEKKGTIKIMESDWTGNWIDIALAKIVLEDYMNYDVELIFADYSAQFAALAEGDLHWSAEMWPSNLHNETRLYVEEQGTVESLGEMGIIGKIFWCVPTYMIEGDPERGIEPMTPDLVSWEQLIQYKDVFVTRETDPKGWFMATVVDWQNRDDERVASLGLDFEVIYAGSEAALIATIAEKYDKGEALITSCWQPWWPMVVYDFTEIELPPYTDECYVSQDYGCAFPPDVTWAAAWPGLKDLFPDAYNMLDDFHLENDDQNEMVIAVDRDGKTTEQAARDWMAENPEKWINWLPEPYRSEVKAELGM